MMKSWMSGILLTLSLLAFNAYAQAQTAATAQPSQVILPPLPPPGPTTAPISNPPSHQTVAQTVTQLLPAGPNNALNPQAVTPAQAMNDPTTEEHYFEESTYGTARDPAFENMLKKMYPMSPEQIAALREAHETTQRAMEAPAQPVPKPTVTSQSVIWHLASVTTGFALIYRLCFISSFCR